MIIDENVRKMVQGRVMELDDIHQVLVRIQDSIEEEIHSIAADHEPDESVLASYASFADRLCNLGRQSMLIMVCSWLEEAMDFLGERLIPDYRKQLGKKPTFTLLELSGLREDSRLDKASRFNESAFLTSRIADPEAPAKKNASWLDRRLYTFMRAGMSCRSSMNKYLLMGHVLQIRNCVVHARGRVANYSYPRQLETAVQWLSTKGKSGTGSLVEIEDGGLFLGRFLVAETNIASHQIITQLYRQAVENEERGKS